MPTRKHIDDASKEQGKGYRSICVTSRVGPTDLVNHEHVWNGASSLKVRLDSKVYCLNTTFERAWLSTVTLSEK